MNSERLRLVSSSLLVREIVHDIIFSLRTKRIQREKKEVIHADLVPKFSEKIVQASMGPRIISPRNSKPLHTEQIMQRLQILPRKIPAQRPSMSYSSQIPAMMPPKIIPPKAPIQQMTSEKDYGKIMPLLNDPSVSSIECPGPGQTLNVIRAGQKQITRIVLSKEEIKEFLTKVAEAAHVPLPEGVFRAAVDNFTISAIRSEMVGSKFILKKQTPYALLESPPPHPRYANPPGSSMQGSTGVFRPASRNK